MVLNQLKEIEKDKMTSIKPGFAFTSLIAGIPLFINSLATVLGFFRTAFSKKGEIKDKLTTFKWDDDVKNTNNDQYTIL
ncbi:MULTISPECIES: hypothetical protein [unclassified Mycoplasma]|uniref:hypothetical protein n=1 Tax=unclassified Mycoplasma TaxID=2683645 RepID=UPI00197BFC78|nr:MULTISPECIES: hypothetical protein [unclassified Mycoplasma]MBN4084582.1 hypothetical protein [Mycoplasma sp. CSL10166]MBU4693060.1 hypothetical protein [Mycoplasma sp. CSL7491-lung]